VPAIFALDGVKEAVAHAAVPALLAKTRWLIRLPAI